MGKCICNEQNGLWYELQGDCHLPCLVLPEEPEVQHWPLGAAAPTLSQKPPQGAACLFAHLRPAFFVWYLLCCTTHIPLLAE